MLKVACLLLPLILKNSDEDSGPITAMEAVSSISKLVRPPYLWPSFPCLMCISPLVKGQ